MRASHLVHTLGEQLAEPGEIALPYVLRFARRRDYLAYIHLLRQTLPLHSLTQLTPLPLISAIRCRIRDLSGIGEWLGLVAIEQDRQVRVDARMLLPGAGRQSMLPLDPAKRIPWGVAAVRAPKLWKKSHGERIRIGIVDTGVDFAHADIKPSLSRGINLLQRHALPIDDNGHGTHIAGTIAASNKLSGIRGVAPAASLFPVKAFDREGSAYVSDIIAAIHWCIAEQMNIINMSFGMSQYSAALHYAVKAALRRNVIIVASSGNSGKRRQIDYPARFPQTIAVGAINRNRRIAAFSNRNSAIDVYAPGEAIYSTWIGGKYNELNGTSMAAAHVSGVAALLMSARPGLKFQQLRAALTSSSVTFAAQKKSAVHRAGRLDAIRAWSALFAGKRHRTIMSAKRSRR